MHPGRFFSAKACCKVVFKSAKIPEAIVFHSDPYLMILPYLMIMAFSGTFYYGTVQFELDILACTISRALPLFSQVYVSG